jgi:hypothetical protein
LSSSSLLLVSVVKAWVFGTGCLRDLEASPSMSRRIRSGRGARPMTSSMTRICGSHGASCVGALIDGRGSLRSASWRSRISAARRRLRSFLALLSFVVTSRIPTSARFATWSISFFSSTSSRWADSASLTRALIGSPARYNECGRPRRCRQQLCRRRGKTCRKGSSDHGRFRSAPG